jgi:NAD(P)-dependent dehydrogenase (short-subunit alcohol dehydrogenase family)
MELTGIARRLTGRRALVTGAGRGIGKAIAARMAGEGARVALVDVDEIALAGAAEAVMSAAPAPDAHPLVVRADVADEDAVAAAVDDAAQAFGGLDVVVANAAVQLVDDERADRLDVEVWRRTVDVNLTGAFLTVKHGVRAVLEERGGAVVVVGSPAGQYGIALGMHAYSASKGGLHGLVRVLAADLAADGVRVNAVLPGITETPMNSWWTEHESARADVMRAVPLGRPADPSEIAAVVAFLASDDASYVTGALWTVDGGLTAV